MLYVVMVSGTAAISVILEYERDTWHGLIATSLTGWEILRAKMLAAIWRARGAALTLISLWVVGLLAGAVHPLGFLNAVVGLIVIGPFYAAFGVSLASADRRTEANQPRDHSAGSVRAAPQRAGDHVAGPRERFAGGLLDPLSSGRRCSPTKMSSPWSTRACSRNWAGRASNRA